MEVSIIRFSEIKDSSFRFDAEHYRHSFLQNRDSLTRFGAVPLRELITVPVKTGHTPSMKNEGFYGGTIKFVKTDNLREFAISEEFDHFLSDSGNQVIKNSELQPNDVIVTIIGATHDIVGRAALIREKHLPANINQNIALIRPNESLSPEFLSVYLNTTIGKNALWHISRQTEQVNLNCREVEQVLVPTMSQEFCSKIEATYALAEQLDNISDEAFSHAQAQLISELGLIDWQPKHDLTFEVNFSEIQKARRMDAEYFQPKYAEIVDAIKGYSGGYALIKDAFEHNKSSFQAEPDQLYNYVEIGSVNISNGEITPKEVMGSELPTNAKRVLKEGDVIVSKVRTYRGGIAIVPQDGYVGSGAFCVLSEKGQVNKETLLAFLHSKPLLEWSLKPNRGTEYPVILDDDILDLPVPLLRQEAQSEVQEMITEACDLRQESKFLLACAVRSVEMAIEQDEKTATDWLEKEV